MGNIKVRHLISKPSGFYFQPSKSMKIAGFHNESLGRDAGGAVARAEDLNREWDQIRAGRKDAPSAPVPPGGTMARLAYDLQRSRAFLDTSQARQTEVEFSLSIILPVFGPSRLSAIFPEDCEKFYANLRQRRSVQWSARVMKDLRYLLNRAMRLRLISSNPALGFKVKQPESRDQQWTPAQVNKAITTGWEMGFRGAAVAIAIGYDTGLRPVDIRKLTVGEIEGGRVRLTQSKTGKPVELPLWAETTEWIAKYHEGLGIAAMPAALVVRTRRGRPYKKDRLARDVRKILRKAGIPDSVQLRDLRRTATTESAANEATVPELAAARGWAMGTAARNLDTYAVRSFGLAEAAQKKRPRNMRGPKV